MQQALMRFIQSHEAMRTNHFLITNKKTEALFPHYSKSL